METGEEFQIGSLVEALDALTRIRAGETKLCLEQDQDPPLPYLRQNDGLRHERNACWREARQRQPSFLIIFLTTFAVGYRLRRASISCYFFYPNHPKSIVPVIHVSVEHVKMLRMDACKCSSRGSTLVQLGVGCPS